MSRQISSGHQCKSKAVQATEGEEFCDAAEVLQEEGQEEAVEGHDQGEVSINAIMGRDKTPSTIKILGWVRSIR